MSFTLNDSTASAQRIAVDNSSNTEFGTATPSTQLSFQGKNLLVSGVLDQRTAAPPGMARISGSISVSAFGVTTISTSTTAGFAGVSYPGWPVAFSSRKTSFDIQNMIGSTQTLNYAVF